MNKNLTMVMTMWAMLVTSLAFAAEPVKDPDAWPCWRGPYGNGTAPDYGIKLTRDKTKVKQLWASEEELPTDWCHGNTGVGIVGGFGGPLAYHDRIYVAYFVPSGDRVDEAIMAAASRDKRTERFKVDADDELVCMDANTGKTIWKKVFKGRGFNRQFYSDSPLFQPVAADGKIYLVGSGGWLYCVDAEKGGLVWETKIGPVADMVEKYKQAGVVSFSPAAKANRELIEPYKEFLDTSPAVAEGVVVVSDVRNFKGGSGENMPGHGLIAFDAKTGEKLWTTPMLCVGAISSPLIWRNGGRSAIVAAGWERAVGLEPSSGKVLWEILTDETFPIVSKGGCTPAVTETYLILPMGRDQGLKEKGVMQGIACWRIDGEKPEKVWFFRSPRGRTNASPVIHRGRVYIDHPSPILLDLENGKQIPGTINIDGSFASPVAADGMIYCRRSMIDATTDSLTSVDLDPAMNPAPSRYVTHAIYKGRLYVRAATPESQEVKNTTGERHRIYCYDVREKQNQYA